MDQDARDARQGREHARAALTQKIEILEQRVRSTVEETRQKLTLAYHVERHPLPMLALSVAGGYLVGRMLAPGRNGGRSDANAAPVPPRAAGPTIRGAAAGVVTSVALQLIREGIAAAAARFGRSRKERAQERTWEERGPEYPYD
ncbi:MAG TPA: hypothetical protein VNL14_16160 [Candidatus Acidoferrales bacterium]|nr:hypothetical protein [Candidatus Acidoferrales bacterium]